ncbi:LIM domain-containing protein 1-like [Erinaceus europaeus]|uniref:LIM domain-containing protein 1-like n=1 Tax=Erinaceus europaeus TaxID=9365 RepID=A0ABM3WVW4_ERIEU|nr:LIM domain-containing protein 1-like [Erinaceus europaeus]
MAKYEDLGLEASKFIEDLDLYEASRDGLFRVDRAAGNNPEFEETRRVFAAKMARIHRQQQLQLQEGPLPRGGRGPVNGGGRPGPQPHCDAPAASKPPSEGAAKPPLAVASAASGPAVSTAAGQPVHPPPEQRARPCLRASRPGPQGCGSKETPAPCEDPSCLTHGDYYDNLSLSEASPSWGDEPGPGVAWPRTPASHPPPKPSREQPLYQPPLALSSSRSFESGREGDGSGRSSGLPAGLWTTASLQRVSPGLPSPGPENGTLLGPAPLRTPSFSAPVGLSCSGQRVLPRTNSGLGREVLGVKPIPAADPPPWLQGGPKSYLSGCAPLSSLAGSDSLQTDAAPGLGPKPSCTDPGTGPKLSPAGLAPPVVPTPPEVSCKEAPPGWLPDGSLGPGLAESPSPPRVRLPCQTLLPSPELGPSPAELKLEALTQRLEREMDAHPKADYFGE